MSCSTRLDKMLRASYIFVVIYCFLNVVLLVEIQERNIFKVCKRDQSTINECVKNSIEILRPNLVTGIPEFNVPSIDPFYINEVIAISGELAPLKAAGKDVKVSGTGNFTIKSVDVDLKTYTVRAQIRFPRLHLEGRYKLDTQILVIPLRGQGNFVVDAVKCDADLEIKSEVYKRDGIEYLKFKSLTIMVNLKDYRIRLNGLFNGDKTLEEATNEAIHQNRGEFLQAMKPYIEKTAAKVLLDTANKIVHLMPLDDLFPKP